MSPVKFLCAFLFILPIASCSTIPKPIEENVIYPHTFTSVAYREEYGIGFGFDHIADLTVDIDKIIFSDKHVKLVITFDAIEEITYKKIFFTDPNNYTVISYRDGDSHKKAMFTAFRYFGWVGGSHEIYEVIQYSYKKYITKYMEID